MISLALFILACIFQYKLVTTGKAYFAYLGLICSVGGISILLA